MTTQKLQILIDAQDRASKKLEGIKGKLAGMKDGMRKVGIAATAMGAAITGAAFLSIKAFQKQERAEARLEQLTKSISNATDEQIQKLKDQATALQKVGVVGDDVVISGQSQLATFALNTEQIGALTPALADMIVAQKGVNSTQEDAITIANAVGRAIDGGAGALTRYGISLSDTQKELFKTANREERVALLAEILTGNFGGLNEKMRETSEGGVAALKNSFGDLMEKVGKPLSEILDKLVQDLAPVIDKLSDWIEKNPKLTKAIVIATAALGGLLVVLGPLLIMLPGIIALFSPVGLIIFGVVAAIVALSAAVVFVVKKWKEMVKAIKDFGGIGKVLGAIGSFAGEKITGLIKGSRQSGGYIPETGLYQLHKGENVIPASGKSGNTFNFNFAGANIVDKENFVKQITKSLNRGAKLASMGI